MVKFHRKILQVFKGVVYETSETGFCAKMEDITNPKNPEEWFTTSLDRLTFNHSNKVIDCNIHHWDVGVSFFWVIGTIHYPDNTEKEYIKFQTIDFGKWTEKEIEEAKKKGKELADFFNNQ